MGKSVTPVPTRSTSKPTSRVPGPVKQSNKNQFVDLIGPGGNTGAGIKGVATKGIAGQKGGAQGLKNLVNFPGNLLNPVIDAANASANGGDMSGAGGSSGGGGGRRRSGGGGGGGAGSAAALPQLPAFQDPYAALRSSLQGAYLGNGVNTQGIQAFLQHLTQAAADKTSQYSADAAAQSKIAGQGIQANLQQSEAARKAGVAAQMNDLIKQGAQTGQLAAVDAQGQAQLAGRAASDATTTSRMADIFSQQSADRQAAIQNTGQYEQGQAANNYNNMLSTVDNQTAQAKAAYDQMVAAVSGSGGGGSGGGGRKSGGSGGGSSSSGGLGSYQDTQTRTLTNNLTNTSDQNSTDLAAMEQAQIWNNMSSSDKAAVQAIETYSKFPEMAQAQGVDLKKLMVSNPNAFNLWMQTQGNAYGYPYQKSTDTSTTNQQQYNRDSSVQKSTYTSPKVKGPPPFVPGQIPHIKTY